jgi:hypothetical protein
MTCHVCVGFCSRSREARKTIAVFDGDDYELDQAQLRSEELPDSRTASELRMFFLVGLCQRVIAKRYIELAKLCNMDVLVEQSWIVVIPTMSVRSLIQHMQAIRDGLDTFTTIEFEMKIRDADGNRSSEVSFFNSGVFKYPMLRAIESYRTVVNCLALSLVRTTKEPQYQLETRCGVSAAAIFNEVGFMPQDYLVVLQWLHTITDKETLDPWEMKIPFLDSLSG